MIPLVGREGELLIAMALAGAWPAAATARGIALRGSTTLSRGAGASIGPVRHYLYGLCRGYWMKDEGVNTN